MTPLCAVILISVLAAIAAFQTSPRAGNDGWISMFDGATLTGWQANEHPESWKVVDGAIVGDGPTSHLFWMVRECDDCGFRAEVKLKPQRKLRHVSTQDVIVDGNHFIIKVNDKVVTDCTGPKNRYAKGYLALQQHNPGSIVQFRNLLMRPLAAGK